MQEISGLFCASQVHRQRLKHHCVGNEQIDIALVPEEFAVAEYPLTGIAGGS